MKVKDVVAAMQKLDPEADVFFSETDGDIFQADYVTLHHVKFVRGKNDGKLGFKVLSRGDDGVVPVVLIDGSAP